MLSWRARATGIPTEVCNHSFRATGITAYLENPEARAEVAQYLGGHADPKTAKHYDRLTSVFPSTRSRGLGFEPLSCLAVQIKRVRSEMTSRTDNSAAQTE